ncbi:hypothetical protein IFM89_034995 [Coptis chinensis]|uniref:Uncharacterized protein n=1 Tax=Coptis chinensis TaxID=261450 RepID=A0A835IPR7_9MAGN|nr:hypothetical protein IFM89_034995 [Coptis chinensis]
MIQLRKNCNHPDLLESAFDGSCMHFATFCFVLVRHSAGNIVFLLLCTNLYPPIEQLVEQCGKFRLLDRLLTKLFAIKHKVLIFSQWTNILDLIEYYFGEKRLEARVPSEQVLPLWPSRDGNAHTFFEGLKKTEDYYLPQPWIGSS